MIIIVIIIIITIIIIIIIRTAFQKFRNMLKLRSIGHLLTSDPMLHDRYDRVFPACVLAFLPTRPKTQLASRLPSSELGQMAAYLAVGHTPRVTSGFLSGRACCPLSFGLFCFLDASFERSLLA